MKVMQTNARDKKEFPLGEVKIPPDFLLRPPPDAHDLYLDLPRRKSPLGVKFTTRGSVRVVVTAISDDRCGAALLPWSQQR